MVQQLMSGPLVALEITSVHGSQTPLKFREFVGPSDPVGDYLLLYSHVSIKCSGVRE